MKLFNKTLLALSILTLAAGSAQAASCDTGCSEFTLATCDYNCDDCNDVALATSSDFIGEACDLNVYTLPAEAPADIQEKLAWGFCELNQNVIEEALDAGANPFIMHKTEIFEKYLSSAEHMDTEEMMSGDEVSPYSLLMASSSLSGSDFLARHKSLKIMNFLIERGISVDRGLCFDGCPNQTFREELQDAYDSYKNTPYFEIASLTHDMLMLIEKHQPEVKA